MLKQFLWMASGGAVEGVGQAGRAQRGQRKTLTGTRACKYTQCEHLTLLRNCHHLPFSSSVFSFIEKGGKNRSFLFFSAQPCRLDQQQKSVYSRWNDEMRNRLKKKRITCSQPANQIRPAVQMEGKKVSVKESKNGYVLIQICSVKINILMSTTWY